MTRNYTVTKYVRRPLKYSTRDFKEMINKVHSDIYYSKKFNVSEGTIKGIRSNQSKKLKIPIKDKWKNQKYLDKRFRVTQ